MKKNQTSQIVPQTQSEAFDPDFTAPAFFDELITPNAHECSAFFLSLAAMLDGYDVRFLRNKKEAGLTFRTLAPEVAAAEFIEISSGSVKRYFQGSQCSQISHPALMATKDKLWTKKLLHIKGINTPVGGDVSVQNMTVLQALANAGVRRFLVKPVEGSLAAGIAANLSAQQAAAHVRRNPKERFIVEQQIYGTEYRTFVVGGKLVGANRRDHQHVIGDGIQTIRQLLEMRSNDRLRNPFFCNRGVDWPQAEIAMMQAGDTLDRLAAVGEKVMLVTRLTANNADNIVGSLDDLPPSVAQTCVKAAKVLGSPILSFDCIVDGKGETFILEANAKTMIRTLVLPHPTGRWSLDIPRAIIAQFLPKPKQPRRVIIGYRFAELRAEVFREGRTKPVNALDFATIC